MADVRVPLGLGEKLILFLFALIVLIECIGWKVSAIIFGSISIWQVVQWYRASTLWTRLGVPSAPALPLLGHLHLFFKKGYFGCDTEWRQKFGKVWGSYLLTQPELVVADPDLLKKVLVKDFANFTNRRTYFRTKRSLLSKIITALKDDEWKHTRNIISPAFTSGKLKGCFGIMEHCTNVLCDILASDGQRVEGVDIRAVTGNMSLDIIAAAAFALEADAQRNPSGHFAMSAHTMGKLSIKNWRVLVSILFPWTFNVLGELFDLRIVVPEMEQYYGQYLLKVIQQRRENPKIKNPDFLQLLVNAAADNNNQNEISSDPISPGKGKLEKPQLSDTDIVAQLFIFLNAGHETASATLSFASYLLALNPQKQDIVYEEIRSLGNKVITYDLLQRGLPYLDAVINETLRIFPPATRFDRVCARDYQLTDQLMIPAGAVVCVPAYAIHHDPDYFAEPEKFEPERFLDKQDINPLTFLPFGYGPRNCVGMRFGLVETKLALAHLVKKFRIEKCAQTEAYPPIFDVSAVLCTKKPIRLRFECRDE